MKARLLNLDTIQIQAESDEERLLLAYFYRNSSAGLKISGMFVQNYHNGWDAIDISSIREVKHGTDG